MVLVEVVAHAIVAARHPVISAWQWQAVPGLALLPIRANLTALTAVHLVPLQVDAPDDGAVSELWITASGGFVGRAPAAIGPLLSHAHAPGTHGIVARAQRGIVHAVHAGQAVACIRPAAPDVRFSVARIADGAEGIAGTLCRVGLAVVARWTYSGRERQTSK